MPLLILDLADGKTDVDAFVSNCAESVDVKSRPHIVGAVLGDLQFVLLLQRGLMGG